MSMCVCTRVYLCVQTFRFSSHLNLQRFYSLENLNKSKRAKVT